MDRQSFGVGLTINGISLMSWVGIMLSWSLGKSFETYTRMIPRIYPTSDLNYDFCMSSNDRPGSSSLNTYLLGVRFRSRTLLTREKSISSTDMSDHRGGSLGDAI